MLVIGTGKPAKNKMPNWPAGSAFLSIVSRFLLSHTLQCIIHAHPHLDKARKDTVCKYEGARSNHSKSCAVYIVRSLYVYILEATRLSRYCTVWYWGFGI
jgi:hypothetical protein